MNRFILCFLFLALVAAMGVSASARDGSGALTFIRAPISTQPQVAASGGPIIVDVTESVYNSCGCRFHLYLDSDGGRVELTDMARLPDPATGVYRFSVNTLPGLETGLYDLIAQKGSNHDTALNAVSLVEEFEPTFRIMQIHDPLVDGVTGYNLELVAERAAHEKPAFIVITGDLVSQATPANVTRALAIIDKMPAPVFMASTTDDESLRAKLGVPPRVFTYGEHVFLLAPPDAAIGCAETPVWDLVKDDANRKAEFEAFNSSGHSLYFYADGNVSTIVYNTLDDDCLKEAVKLGVPPADSGTPAVRVFSVSKDGVSIK